MLEHIVFVQLLRTPHSEVWLADFSRAKKEAFAQIDIHYLPERVEATVVLFRPLKTEELLHEFLKIIDDELISRGDVEKHTLQFRVIHGGTNKAELYEPSVAQE